MKRAVIGTRAQGDTLPLAHLLVRRFVTIAVVVFGLNALAVGLYYGTDMRALTLEAFNNQMERIEDALEGDTLPTDAAARDLYAAHPTAYAFALVDRGGRVLDAMNAELIPPGATDIFADDWITTSARAGAPMTVAGHEFAERSDGLRMVFVIVDDPARLIFAAYLDELYQHVFVPIVPLAVLLTLAGAILIRRGLAPVTKAAAWARGLTPGTPPPPPPDATLPAEVADLVDATQASLDRLAEALAAEKRRAAEAAHALRTPVAVLMARLDGLPPGEATDQLHADLGSLSRTVAQVLAAGRADGFQVSHTALLDLRDPAEGVIAALAPFAYDHGVSLSLEVANGPVMACADREAVELALTNLVENAILHGGPDKEVRVDVGPGAEIAVKDSGSGLPDGENKRLFDPFWRAPGAVEGGTGLGLAIVDRLQRAQGGSVEGRTGDTGGAVFRLIFRPA